MNPDRAASSDSHNRSISNGDQVSRVSALVMKRASRWTSPAIGSAILPTEPPPDRRRKLTVIEGGKQ